MGSEVLEDYYKILQCDRSAPLEEIKKNYQRLVLAFHPDKNTSSKSNEKFLNIQKAWSVLKDPQSRSEYDALVSCKEHQGLLLYASVSVVDLRYDRITSTYSYKCRCGGLYSVAASEIEPPEMVLQCDDCSLSLQINVPPEKYKRIYQLFKQSL